LSIIAANASEEEREFRATLRRFLEDVAPMAEVRRIMESDSGHEPVLWRRLVEELGLAGLAIAEAEGGQGFGPGELAIALGELGRALVPVPFFASAVLAGRAVEAVASVGEKEEDLAAIARGEIASLAWVEGAGGWDPAACRVVAETVGGGFRLRGEKSFVLDLTEVERVYVVARQPGSTGLDGLGLFAVEAEASGFSRKPRRSLDGTRRLGHLVLDDVKARPVGSPGEAGPALDAALGEATILLCAEIVGGLELVLESAVEYAKARYQFGRPIGSFQAIKHKCADMLIELEGARSATEAALEALIDGDAERALLTSIAKAHCGPAYSRAAMENVQIHGGVGFTWEYDAHLYYRRAKSSDILLGDAAFHRERIACALEADAESEDAGVGERRAS